MSPTRRPLPTAARKLGMVLARCRTLTEALVVTAIAAAEAKYGNPTPSRAQLAARIKRCERSVSRATTALEARGVLYVRRDTPHKREDGTFCRTRTNLYRLRWPKKGAKPVLAPMGHQRHVYAASRSNSTGGPPASPPPAAPLPLPLESEPPETPPEAPVAPPWVALGLTFEQWRATLRES